MQELTIEQLKKAREIGAVYCAIDPASIRDGFLGKEGFVFREGSWLRWREGDMVSDPSYRFEIDFSPLDEKKEPEMQKLTPKSLKCFEQVAKVIGDDAAEVELQKVIDDGEVCGSEVILRGAFIFDRTTQKYDFWDSIDNGEIPEQYQPAASEQKATSDEKVYIAPDYESTEGTWVLTPKPEINNGRVGVAVFSKYHRQIKPDVFVDVYDVLDAFKVECPALQHLTKKALAAGNRGHKDTITDLKDIIASAERALQLELQRQELAEVARLEKERER